MRIVCRRFAKKSQDGDTTLNRSILGPPTRGLPLEVYNPTIYIELPFQKLYKMAPNSNLAHCALLHFHAYDVRTSIEFAIFIERLLGQGQWNWTPFFKKILKMSFSFYCHCPILLQSTVCVFQPESQKPLKMGMEIFYLRGHPYSK